MSTEQTNPRDVIAQALALSEAATDGPWEATGWVVRAPHLYPGWEGVVHFDAPEDATLTAAARTLLPALAKALGAVLDLHEAHEAPLVRADRAGRCQCVACDMGRAITAALSEVTP